MQNLVRLSSLWLLHRHVSKVNGTLKKIFYEMYVDLSAVFFDTFSLK